MIKIYNDLVSNILIGLFYLCMFTFIVVMPTIDARYAKAACPDIQLRLLPNYQAVYDEFGNVTSRFLKYLVVRQEDDDGTFIYDVCLTYYQSSTPIPGVVMPTNPPCVQTVIGSVDGAVVQFDVKAGWTFDVQSSVTLLNGEGVMVEVFSNPSACTVVTGASDLTGDGRTGGPDFSLFVDEIGMEFSEADPDHNAP